MSDAFDDEGTIPQTPLWSIWYLTPRVFEKEFKDEQERLETNMALLSQGAPLSTGNFAGIPRTSSTYQKLPPSSTQKKEIVLGHWDPELYHSKLWPVACLFGASFGALHLIC